MNRFAAERIDRAASNRLRCFVAGFALALGVAACGAQTPEASARSRWHEIAVEDLDGDDATADAELSVEIVESTADGRPGSPLPARIVVTDANGRPVDGSGRGTYADGRFFADGSFSVRLVPGTTRIAISAGPHIEPLETTVVAIGGKRIRGRAFLRRRFDPASIGWFGGDNHVHTQHDRFVSVRVDAGYTALQARANGLNFITEADTGMSDAADGRFDTESFLYRAAPEIRPGPFVGHFNTPGIERLIPEERLADAVGRPTPGQGLRAVVRELGGASIHTHPFTPPHQLHWMGAAEAWVDAAIGESADLLDLDSRHSQALWFAMLNLGCRVGASSYTDCALGRDRTPSPGDRRVYCRADSLDYAALVESMRAGRTVATNGGPLFVDFSIAGRTIGDSIDAEDAARSGKTPVRIRCWSENPLASVELICGGKRLIAFDARGRAGALEFDGEVDLADRPADWFVVRAESEEGDWAVASPIYVDSSERDVVSGGGGHEESDASAILFEIANCTRFVELRKDFFAHGIVCVRPTEGLEEVRLFRNDDLLKSFRPEGGDAWANGKVPVTGIDGDYAAGWAWHREGDVACRFQFDWPADASGRYRLEATTTRGRIVASETLRCDVDAGKSFAISSARLDGPGTSLVYRGYGEEMPLNEIALPFEGDHWWYPNATYWQLSADLYGSVTRYGTGDGAPHERFGDAAVSKR